MLKRAEYALKNDEAKRKEIEEIVGFTYEPSLEILALMDVILNRIGLEKVQEKVKKPLKGLKAACYYGCALVRHPKITRLDDPENPQYLDRLVKTLGAQPVEWSYKSGLLRCGPGPDLWRGGQEAGGENCVHGQGGRGSVYRHFLRPLPGQSGDEAGPGSPDFLLYGIDGSGL